MNREVSTAPMPIAMLQHWAQQTPEKTYLRQPRGDHYQEYSWGEVSRQVLSLAAAFKSLGLETGDRVVILSENCAEWFITDFAIQAAGLISVPIYYTAGKETISYIVDHSGARAVVVGKLADFSAAQAAIPEQLISIAMPYLTMPCRYQMSDLLQQHEPLKMPHQPDHQDTFSITYTSGSTGKPKGVVLTYRNIMYGGISAANLMEQGMQARVISYLPLAHITERALIEYSSLYVQAEVTFNHSLDTFLEDLKSARVTFFLSVPRLWLKFQAGVLSKLPQERLDILLRIPVICNLVKRRIKRQLGLEYVRSCGCGSAPVPPSILQWYARLGIEISEAWGMTECSGMGTTNFPFRGEKIGTIGHAMEGLEIKLSEQGEILLRGDAVFKEYYKNPEATAETFTDDGFMRTGDKAEMDADGYLTITGRVKDQFKTAKGKYVAPVPLESKLGINQLIEQSCVMGAGLPQPVVAIVLSQELTAGLSREEISQSLSATLASVNAEVEKHECMGGIYIASDSWTVENGLLTPTLKIKRAELEQKYSSLISRITGGEIVWQ